MLSRFSSAVLTAALLISSAAVAQTPKDVPDTIRQKLTELGFKDVEVAPGSYIVSAKDKNDNQVMMLIGPTEMTVLTVQPQDRDQQRREQAQTPDAGDSVILQQ